MPLQNFSASALHSSRSLPAFSARAFELSRHAGESSASCAFMHLAIAPCPGFTPPHNFLTSAAQGPSLRCWAPASAATPAAESANAIVTNAFLVDMAPPKFLIDDRVPASPAQGRIRIRYRQRYTNRPESRAQRTMRGGGCTRGSARRLYHPARPGAYQLTNVLRNPQNFSCHG